ncbi:MAG: holo-ACP synthase [Desulfuromonadaceae bacterium]|nr:holo-ACP synthase [Desulfuromonadaceae bacterium]
MAVAGIGTDIVQVDRFEAFLTPTKHAVLERLFTPTELSYALPRKQAAQHLAARFAAKEAFLKALGLGLRDGITWQDMEVRRDENGAPSLFLCGVAAEIFQRRGLRCCHLSYSHEQAYATATVIVEDER